MPGLLHVKERHFSLILRGFNGVVITATLWMFMSRQMGARPQLAVSRIHRNLQPGDFERWPVNRCYGCQLTAMQKADQEFRGRKTNIRHLPADPSWLHENHLPAVPVTS